MWFDEVDDNSSFVKRLKRAWLLSSVGGEFDVGTDKVGTGVTSGLRDVKIFGRFGGLGGQGLAPDFSWQSLCGIVTGEWCEVEVVSGKAPGIFFSASRYWSRDGPHDADEWCRVEFESDSEDDSGDTLDLWLRSVHEKTPSYNQT